jgi:predicted transcriptional regulator
MSNTHRRRALNLGRAEQAVMDHLWSSGPSSAESCRLALHSVWRMKDSTMRTVLRRLERKGYVTHEVEGRAFIYRALDPPSGVAARAVKHIIDRLCGGSAETLVIGLVDHDVLSTDQVKRLAKAIAARKEKKP